MVSQAKRAGMSSGGMFPAHTHKETLQLIQEVIFSKQDPIWKRHK